MFSLLIKPEVISMLRAKLTKNQEGGMKCR